MNVVADFAEAARVRRDVMILERAKLAGCLLTMLEHGGFDEMKRAVDLEVARVAAGHPEEAAKAGWIG